MAKKVYLKKDEETLKNTGKLVEITAQEFKDLVNSIDEGEKRYFISLTDDIDYECSEIVIETSKSEYVKWKKEYDRHHYLRMHAVESEQYDAFETMEDQYGMRTLLEKTGNEDDDPEYAVCRKEDYLKLKGVLLQLEPMERELIYRLYLDENTYTVRELAELYGVGKSTIQKRKEKYFEENAKFMVDKMKKVHNRYSEG